jgi:hypothetical protein
MAYDGLHACLIMKSVVLKIMSFHSGENDLISPWLNANLTNCKADKPPREIPDGKILT